MGQAHVPTCHAQGKDSSLCLRSFAPPLNTGPGAQGALAQHHCKPNLSKEGSLDNHHWEHLGKLKDVLCIHTLLYPVLLYCLSTHYDSALGTVVLTFTHPLLVPTACKCCRRANLEVTFSCPRDTCLRPPRKQMATLTFGINGIIAKF
jgi:hypothetical protein